MKKRIIFLSIIVGVFCFGSLVKAEQTTLTIVPPLIKINMSPGDSWSSSVKMVNNNSKELILFAQAVDFRSGESGGVEFILPQKTEGEDKIFLSEWIEIDSGPQILPAFESREIPFTIRLPESASPGGHYAAILVGTRPLDEEEKGTSIKISSNISSLILLNIAGEIDESGWIREFSTEKDFYQKPEIDIRVAFDNTGNVHLQPVGAIKIYNMWDKERGTIPINQKSHFGNVLAHSKRVWDFTWKGEESAFEVGRYKAEITLGFGEEAHQTVSSTLYFWVIPLAPILGILGGIILFFLAISLGIKAYIKRAVLLAQRDAGIVPGQTQEVLDPQEMELTAKILRGPIDEAIVDLREMRHSGREEGERPAKGLNFLFKKYYKVVLFFSIILFWVIGLSLYLQDTQKAEKNFEVIQKIDGGERVISSEEIFKEEILQSEKKENKIEEPFSEEKRPVLSVKILNGSGVPRVVARTAILLESGGMKIEKIGNADNFDYKETVIKYKKGLEETAEFLKQLLHGMGKLEEVEDQVEDIVVIIGFDYVTRISE